MRGKKTDLEDGGRIVELLQDGRLAGSYVPPVAIRVLRIQRLLEQCNVKLASVASDVLGVPLRYRSTHPRSLCGQNAEPARPHALSRSRRGQCPIAQTKRHHRAKLCRPSSVTLLENSSPRHGHEERAHFARRDHHARSKPA